MKLPTDYEILNQIYKMYYSEFRSHSKENPNRGSKNYVPIDIRKIADQLNVDADIVFGRLYFYLEEKYSYQKSDKSWVHLFAFKIGDDMHAINFPMLASVLAGMKEEKKKSNISFVISIAALVISLLTFGLNSLVKLEALNHPTNQMKTQSEEVLPSQSKEDENQL